MGIKEKTAALEKFFPGLMQEDISWVDAHCTPDATLKTPGGGPMPIKPCCGMFLAFKKTAFPDWFTHVIVKTTEDSDTVICHTQERAGSMKADLPGIGPFPACKLADASPECKDGNLVTLNYQIGTATFEGDKIKTITFADTVEEGIAKDEDNSVATAPGVGIGAVYGKMGVKMGAH